jgi:hypothetical protein
MSTPYYRKVTLDLRAARFAVNAGLASWRKYDLGVAAPTPKPAPKPTPKATPFGQGILASRPSYRSPVALSDMQWWADECANAEARDLEQRAGEFEAANRLEMGGVL